VVGFTIGSRGKVPGKTCEKRIQFRSVQFISFIYVLENRYGQLQPSTKTTTIIIIQFNSVLYY
jgi:hypothetical protein